jgi:hypothetical protein
MKFHPKNDLYLLRSSLPGKTASGLILGGDAAEKARVPIMLVEAAGEKCQYKVGDHLLVDGALVNQSAQYIPHKIGLPAGAEGDRVYMVPEDAVMAKVEDYQVADLLDAVSLVQ